MTVAINESHELVRTLVTTAHEFLLLFLQHEGRLSERRIMLVKAARDVVFSASYIDSYHKHELLHDVHEKLETINEDDPTKETRRAAATGFSNS